MSLLTASEIVTLALRKIGTLSSIDDQADSDTFSVGLQYLSLIIDELIGVGVFPWNVPVENQRINLEIVSENPKNEYNLVALLSTPLQYIENVYLYLDEAYQCELKIIRRNQYDSYQPVTGNPEFAYISAGVVPYLYPCPQPDVLGFHVELKGMTFPADVLSDNGQIAHGLPQAWQLYLVTRLAAEIGNGPVVRLNVGIIQGFQRDCKLKYSDLIGSRAATEQKNNERLPRLKVF